MQDPRSSERLVASDMDNDVNALADELARRLLLSGRTEAIRFALRASLAAAEHESSVRHHRLLKAMDSEIWPLLHDQKPIQKADRENILGLNPSTGV